MRLENNLHNFMKFMEFGIECEMVASNFISWWLYNNYFN